MTSQISKKYLTAGLRTPCQQHSYSTNAISNLPQYINDMRGKRAGIRCTTVSGLAPTFEGGTLDDCVRAGAWSSQQQLAHGGPIPFLSGYLLVFRHPSPCHENCSRGNRSCDTGSLPLRRGWLSQLRASWKNYKCHIHSVSTSWRAPAHTAPAA